MWQLEHGSPVCRAKAAVAEASAAHSKAVKHSHSVNENGRIDIPVEIPETSVMKISCQYDSVVG
jgi:hypothetical protein